MIARLRREVTGAIKRDRESALRAERNQCKARAERAEADLAEVMLERDVLSGVMDIVERIMTQHWDMAACWCWVCQSGREFGCRPREVFLADRYRYPRVDVEIVKSL